MLPFEIFRQVVTAILIGAATISAYPDEASTATSPAAWEGLVRVEAVVTATPDPGEMELRLAKRATGTSHIGYAPYSGQWLDVTCPPGSFFAAAATWGACCASASTGCYLPTACQGNTVLVSGGLSVSCDNNRMCDTMTIMNTPGVKQTGIRSMINCIPSSVFYIVPRTIYRVTWALTTSTPTKTSTTVSTTTSVSRTVSVLVSTVTLPLAPTSTSGVIGGTGDATSFRSPGRSVWVLGVIGAAVAVVGAEVV